MKKAGSARDPLWYKDAVIYETHVKAFFDGNNDGTGDFPGLAAEARLSRKTWASPACGCFHFSLRRFAMTGTTSATT